MIFIIYPIPLLAQKKKLFTNLLPINNNISQKD